LLFIALYFMYWKTDAKQYLGKIFGVFLVFLWTIRFVVEYVKESQGGFESSLGLFSTGQWLSIPFIIAGFYLWFTAKNRTVNSILVRRTLIRVRFLYQTPIIKNRHSNNMF